MGILEDLMREIKFIQNIKKLIDMTITLELKNHGYYEYMQVDNNNYSFIFKYQIFNFIGEDINYKKLEDRLNEMIKEPNRFTVMKLNTNKFNIIMRK